MAGRKRHASELWEDFEMPHSRIFTHFDQFFDSATPSPLTANGLGSKTNPIELDSEDGAQEETPATTPMSIESLAERSVPPPTTSDDLLKHARDLFPDISQKFVLELHHETDHLASTPVERCTSIVERILQRTSYPKQKNEQQEASAVLNSPASDLAAHWDPNVRKEYHRRT